jgi:Homeodomain-like domain
MRRAKLEGRRIGCTPLNIDRVQVVADRLSGMSLTEVAKKYRVSRATICRLVNASGGLKKSSMPNLVMKKEWLLRLNQATCRLPLNNPRRFEISCMTNSRSVYGLLRLSRLE